MSFCVVFVSVCFVEMVDTKIVLTAAILFYRHSRLTPTEWELSHQTFTMVLYPASRNLCGGDCCSCVTHHSFKLSLIGPKQQLSICTNSISVSAFLLSFPPSTTRSSDVFTHTASPTGSIPALTMEKYKCVQNYL